MSGMRGLLKVIAVVAVGLGIVPAKAAVGDGGVSAFYVWDGAVPVTPGRLLRQEPLAPGVMPASSAVRILYSSKDGLEGKTPIAVSGAVYFPNGQRPVPGWPVIAWAHGTAGVADVCAPSWRGRSQRDVQYLSAWLSRGYAIVATDYQGLGTPGGHAWLHARAEAFSVLDSVRAAQSTFPELSDSVVLVGQSQGAQAALSAALLAQEYAPRINVKGVIATGVPGMPPFVDAASSEIPTPRWEGGNFPIYYLLLLLSREVVEPQFDATRALTQMAQAVLPTARTECIGEIAEATRRAGLTVDNQFIASRDDLLARLAPYLQYPGMRFVAPVFIGAGVEDIDTFPEGQYNFAVAACRAGSRIELHYYPYDHGGALNPSLADSIPFVERALSDQPIPGNCRDMRPPSRSP